MANENLKNIIGVALIVCLVCSILVAAATVILKSRQETNQRLEKLKNILIAADLLPPEKEGDAEAIFAEKIRPLVIELKTGEPVTPEKITANPNLAPEKFDIKIIAGDPGLSRLIHREEDIANIKKAPLYMPVYFVTSGKKEEKAGTEQAAEVHDFNMIILPVYGSGLWSTIYAFLALDKDLKTVRGFTVYEHGETPGLGGEITNPVWQNSWKGKIAFNDKGEFVLRVIKRAGSESRNEIDGLSGATLTTRGVDNFIHFWLGPAGYGPFLDKLKSAPQQGNEMARRN